MLGGSASELTTATRVDEERGIQVDAEFFGEPGGRMLGLLHRPIDGEPRAGVLICPSLHAELMVNYRREVLLANALAELGYAAQRFHYRGSGNSEGRDEDLSLDTMGADAHRWARRLVDRGVDRLGVFGVRFGALVGAGVARQFPAAPLALWQPTVTGDRYFREVLRTQLMREMKGGSSSRPAGSSLTDELDRASTIDVLGYSIHRTLHASAEGSSLVDELGPAPRPVLVVQISRETDLSAELAGIVAAWRAAGGEVRTHLVSKEPGWWFVGEDWKAEEERDETHVLLDTTVNWLAGELGGPR
ncbi:hypothetical protein BH20ACT2_BH20ACT2_08560 [soil metagenome]